MFEYPSDIYDQPLDFSKSSRCNILPLSGKNDPPIPDRSPSNLSMSSLSGEVDLCQPFRGFRKTSPGPLSVNLCTLPLHLATDIASDISIDPIGSSEEEYKKFREEMIKRKSQETRRRHSNPVSPCLSSPSSNPPSAYNNINESINNINGINNNNNNNITNNNNNKNTNNTSITCTPIINGTSNGHHPLTPNGTPNGNTNNHNNKHQMNGDSNMSSLSSASNSPHSDAIPSSNSSETTSTTNGTPGNRKKGKPLPDSLKDAAYWERRRKNNEAAKRSRDARRAKEDEIAIRAAFLEQENLRLRLELKSLRQETHRLKCILYSHQ